MKFCKDCKYHALGIERISPMRPLSEVVGVHQCGRNSVDIDLVTGEKKGDTVRKCYNERADPEGCGPEGKYWESMFVHRGSYTIYPCRSKYCKIKTGNDCRYKYGDACVYDYCVGD